MSYSLDDLKTIADNKYPGVPLTVDGQDFELVNVLRLSEKDRKEFQNLIEKFGESEPETDEEEAEQGAAFKAVLIHVANNKELANKFLDGVGDDLGMLVALFELYSKKAQVGEA